MATEFIEMVSVVPDQLFTSDLYEDIKNNLEFVNDKPQTHYEKPITDSNITTVGTSFGSISSSFSRSLTVDGDMIEVVASGHLTHSTTGTVTFDITIDGVSVTNSASTGIWSQRADIAGSFNIVRKFTVSPGSHTVELLWKTSSGTATLQSSSAPQFTVTEV